MSGLAGKVRRATESDEFDLANYDQSRCDELVKAAFTEPFPLKEMVKLSFVVGGGKLVRQKYTDDLPKIFMSSLSTGGFQDDNTAALEASSGGKFKFQHDTGKNLKFVHVFPHICAPAAAAVGGGGEEEEEEEGPTTPEDLLLTCDMDEFKQLVERQLETYGQKRRLLDIFKARISKLEEIEAKMTKLEQINPEEQALFDGVGADELREKSKALSAELQGMVEIGRLTSSEKAGLLEQLEVRLEAAEADRAKAEAEGKAKRAQALQQQIEALEKNRKAAKDCSPVGLPQLKHAQALRKLHAKLAELAKIEKQSKGSYTLAELQKLGEKPEIEDAIKELEKLSRGWLEADEVFQERLRECVRGAAAGGGKRAPPPPGGGGYGGAASRPSTGSSASGGFSTVSRGGAKPPKAKGAAPSTRNAFGALS